mgnify:CR=1 FL=1
MNRLRSKRLRKEKRRERMIEAIFWLFMIPASIGMVLVLLALTRVFFVLY